MGSIATTADMESPKRYCCCCICYFCVADHFYIHDADYFDYDNFMFRYEDIQKFTYVVDIDWVQRGCDYQYMQEQRQTSGSPIASAVRQCAWGDRHGGVDRRADPHGQLQCEPARTRALVISTRTRRAFV